MITKQLKAHIINKRAAILAWTSFLRNHYDMMPADAVHHARQGYTDHAFEHSIIGKLYLFHKRRLEAEK